MSELPCVRLSTHDASLVMFTGGPAVESYVVRISYSEFPCQNTTVWGFARGESNPFEKYEIDLKSWNCPRFRMVVASLPPFDELVVPVFCVSHRSQSHE